MTEKLFDKAEEYNEMLNDGLKLSGESKEYFLYGRIDLMNKHLPKSFYPTRILDFGCGIGDTCEALAKKYPESEIMGVDTSSEALSYAIKNRSSEIISYQTVDDFDERDRFDLTYVNGVFHHIPLLLRAQAANKIFKALTIDGQFAYFENNPWNPVTRIAMSRIRFDRETVTLSYRESKTLLINAGFSNQLICRFAFYFPKSLSILRFLEPTLERLPLGAQYLILAKKEQ